MRLSEAGEISIRGYEACRSRQPGSRAAGPPPLGQRLGFELDPAGRRCRKDVVEQDQRLAVRSGHLQRLVGRDVARPDARQPGIGGSTASSISSASVALKHGSSNSKRAARRRKISVFGSD